MTLIKNAQAAMLAREAVVLDLGDLRRQGEALVAQARARAEAIVREAEAERDRIVAGAAERGHAEGVERGLSEGRRKGEEAGRAEALTTQSAAIETMTARWTEAVSAFEADRTALLESAQRDVIRLAVLIGERVTKRIVETDPSVASEQVAEALRLVLRPTGVVVAVNPEDRAMVESALPGLVATIGAASHVQLVDDPALSRGSCIVRCVGNGAEVGAGAGAGGEIDATIGTQLERIAELIVPGGDDGRSGGGRGEVSA
ncbi:MAG: hypothetical protein KF768_05960 [Phycisphaeraceae bacterium]|nr:hypothetical protein [Phycisphaeraceae bacterium]